MHTNHPYTVELFRPLSALLPAHWQTGSVQVEDGAYIHYFRTGGAKPGLLLLHGVQGSGSMWLRTAQALEATYDVVMPDFRGHGQSSRVAAALSKHQLVEDMVAVLRALGITHPFIAGHSMGAEVAGRLAAAYPTQAVALVDPALRNFAAAMAFDPDNPPPWMVPILQTMHALKSQSHAERMVSGLRLLPPGTPVWEEADYVSFIDGLAHFDQVFYRSAATLGYLFEEPEVIAQIDCPILLLTARPMMPGTDIEAGAAAFTHHWHNGRRLHFADSGHFIPFDQFTRFIDVLNGFLTEHKATP